MRTRLLSSIFILSLLVLPVVGFTQASSSEGPATTQQEEVQGKAILDRLQSKQVTCSTISESDFELIGEYAMGQMLGDGHEAMNQRAQQMMGQSGETQMHITMGKRLSECFADAVFPRGMMGMMTGLGIADGADYDNSFSMMGRGRSFGNGADTTSPRGPLSMMHYGYTGYGFFGPVMMILWWLIIIGLIIILIRWLRGSHTGTFAKHSHALTILRERYAKGEIDKKEFDESRKDLE
ncbi:MAG: SHOCT domain-containing protein [Candidatus Peregrinibacteria bacterium]